MKRMCVEISTSDRQRKESKKGSKKVGDGRDEHSWRMLWHGEPTCFISVAKSNGR